MSAAQPSRRRTKITAEPEPERTPRWASPADAAEYAGFCTKTFYRWIQAGDLPAVRAGKRALRVDLNDVDALMRGGVLS